MLPKKRRKQFFQAAAQKYKSLVHNSFDAKISYLVKPTVKEKTLENRISNIDEVLFALWNERRKVDSLVVSYGGLRINYSSTRQKAQNCQK